MSFLTKIFGENAIVTSPPVVTPAPTAKPPQAPAESKEDFSARIAALSDEAVAQLALTEKHANLRLAAAQALAARPTTSAISPENRARWEVLLKATAEKDRRVHKLAREEVQRQTAAANASAHAVDLTARFTKLAATAPVDLTRLIEADHELEELARHADDATLVEVRAARATVEAKLNTEQTAQRTAVSLERAADALKVKLVAGLEGLHEEADPVAALRAQWDALDAGSVPAVIANRTRAALDGLEAVAATVRARSAAEVKAKAFAAQIEAFEVKPPEVAPPQSAPEPAVVEGAPTTPFVPSADPLLAAKALQAELTAAALPDDLARPLFAALAQKTGLATAQRDRIRQAETAAQRDARQAERNATRAAKAAEQHAADEKLQALIARAEEELAQGHALAVLKFKRAFFEGKAAAEHLAPAWRARYHAVETDLLKLEGFARDKAREQRDALITRARALPELALPPDLLASEIQAMQVSWKEIDAQAGAAPRKVWEVFHNATNAAYERVTVYRAVKAHEREENAGVRKALLAEASALAAQLLPPVVMVAEGEAPVTGAPATPDWKALANGRATLIKRWFEVGPMNRAESKELKAQFDAQLEAIEKALDAERKRERSAKEGLIEKVKKALEEARSAPLSVEPAARPAPDKRFGDRGAEKGREGRFGRDSGRDQRDTRDQAPPAVLAAMRTAQEAQKAWSALKSPVPLNRKEGDKLWDRFRTTCNAIFALRDEQRAAQKAQGEQARAAIDKLIEDARAATVLTDPVAVDGKLSELTTAMAALEAVDAAGTLRGAKERFDAAIAKAREYAKSLRRAAKASVWQQLIELDQGLCALDVALAEDMTTGGLTTLRERTVALGEALEGALKQQPGLAKRLAALDDSARAVPTHSNLVEGGELRAQLLIEMELSLNLETPPEAANQRRARQLQMLAGKMKRGDSGLGAGGTPPQLFAKWLTTPAVADASQEARALAIAAVLG